MFKYEKIDLLFYSNLYNVYYIIFKISHFRWLDVFLQNYLSFYTGYTVDHPIGNFKAVTKCN